MVIEHSACKVALTIEIQYFGIILIPSRPVADGLGGGDSIGKMLA